MGIMSRSAFKFAKTSITTKVRDTWTVDTYSKLAYTQRTIHAVNTAIRYIIHVPDDTIN